MEDVNEYKCQPCGFVSYVKCNYDRHCLSKKHINGGTTTRSSYSCLTCNFITTSKFNYERHCDSERHKRAIINMPPNYVEPEHDDYTEEELLGCLKISCHMCIIEMMKLKELKILKLNDYIIQLYFTWFKMEFGNLNP